MKTTEQPYFVRQFERGRLIAQNDFKDFKDDAIVQIDVSERIDAKDLIDAIESQNAPHAGLKLRGFEIVGDLDLRDRKIDFLISFSHCSFTGQIVLDRSQLRAFRLNGCSVRGKLSARRAIIETDVELIGGVNIGSGVIFEGARIGGQLDAREIRCGAGAANEPALDISSASIGREALFDSATDNAHQRDAEGAQFNGFVKAESLEVGKTLSFAGAKITLPAKGSFIVLNASAAQIGSVFKMERRALMALW